MKKRIPIPKKLTKKLFLFGKIGLGGLFIIWLFCLPKPLFDFPTATVVESSQGHMLGARIASDGQWRFPEIDSLPHRFEKCILYFEDEYFYQHPGFNPISISKALWNNFKGNPRRGGSTITQQVIRLSRVNKNRTYFEKLVEIFQATRLEIGYSKKSILKLYASYAPFGGNVVGLETASWRYFNIPASELSWGQSAALAVLPNAPSLIFPGKNEVILKQKRDALLLKLFENDVIDKMTYELALDEDLPGKPFPLPDHTPHLTEKIRKEQPGNRVVTTIDFSFQNKVNHIAKEHHRILSQNQVHNLAILVMDVNTRQVLAYVGNSPTTKDHSNFVDIIQKSRSTGSILKPFLYASMLHSGEILPNTLVADVPTSINGYSPENYDKTFSGVVPASVSLSRSLNIPAVRMLRDYGLHRLYNMLQKTNQKGIDKPADHYGLSYILGGAESSLWDVTKAYMGMASTLNFFNASSSEYREIEYMDPVYTLDNADLSFGKTLQNPTVWNAGAIYKTFEAMQQVNRPTGEENWEFFSSSQPLAWKTGTSYGFKDAWAVGVTPKYAIGVWAGNASGEGRTGLTGILAAAPILFDVLSALPQSGWFQPPYDELVETEICAQSGHLSGLFCAETKTEWIPKDGLKTKACPYHQTVFLNNSETYRVNSSCYPLSEMKQKNWFTLPPVLEYYYAARHPEYKTLPPFAPDCLNEGESIMAFIYPKRNEAILLPKDFDETVNDVVFKIAHRLPDTTVYWYLDSEYVGKTQTFHELAISPKPGSYLLTVVDGEGNELKEKIEIVRTR